MPRNRRAYKVPGELRAVITCIIDERAKLNKAHYVHGGQYYALSSLVEATYAEVEKVLREAACLSANSIIQLHADWVYTHTTLGRIQAGYEARHRKTVRRARKRKGGLSFVYRERPPEHCHLSRYYLLTSGVTLLDFMAHERRIHKAPHVTGPP